MIALETERLSHSEALGERVLNLHSQAGVGIEELAGIQYAHILHNSLRGCPSSEAVDSIYSVSSHTSSAVHQQLYVYTTRTRTPLESNKPPSRYAALSRVRSSGRVGRLVVL
jgi:hypothetical protein